MAEPWTDDDILSGRVMLLLSEAPTPADAERVREFMGRLVPTLLRLRGELHEAQRERDEAQRERDEARGVAAMVVNTTAHPWEKVVKAWELADTWDREIFPDLPFMHAEWKVPHD
jgi:hypothetical protein